MQGAPSTAPNSGIPAGRRLRSVEDALEAGGHAAGVIFRDPDGRILLLRRSPTEENYAGHWALPGGKAELGESPEEAARRETGEEIGSFPDGDMRLVDRKRTPTGMTFHTFAQDVPEAFEPRLNGEHSEHAWAAQDDLPTPLHPAVARTLQERGREIAGDAEFKESDHPRAPDGKFGSGGGGSGGEAKKERPQGIGEGQPSYMDDASMSRALADAKLTEGITEKADKLDSHISAISELVDKANQVSEREDEHESDSPEYAAWEKENTASLNAVAKGVSDLREAVAQHARAMAHYRNAIDKMLHEEAVQEGEAEGEFKGPEWDDMLAGAQPAWLDEDAVEEISELFDDEEFNQNVRDSADEIKDHMGDLESQVEALSDQQDNEPEIEDYDDEKDFDKDYQEWEEQSLAYGADVARAAVYLRDKIAEQAEYAATHLRAIDAKLEKFSMQYAADAKISVDKIAAILGGDAEFKEGDHPRAPDGKFGSGGGSSGQNKSQEEIRNERFENKLKEEPTQLFKNFLTGPGVSKEKIEEGKSHLAEIHRQLEGERKERGTAIEKERLEKAEKLGGKPGEHAAALIKAGTSKEKFEPVFEALKADKSISASDLTQISQLYGHHVSKGSKAAMLDQIEKAFIRNARFENKISGDEPSLTREQAGYVFPAPGPDFCQGCSMFRPAADGQHDDKCTLVKGGIEAKGVCDHFAARGATDSALLLALDKDSVRSLDKDGRMRVETTNISKATVNPYVGHEIPDWEKLGLDPNKIYQMLRDPEELRKAAPTFNGVQLLRKHIPVSAEDHQPYDIVGTTGTDAEFDGTYLKNSLHVWTQEAIDDIESEAKKELSCGYHYRADMTPGVFDGKAFDGVMRDIVGNHVALVKDGRAGPDVVVGDSNEGLHMTNKELATKLAALAARQTTIGSIYSYLRPRIKIAQDSKPLGIGAAFKDVTGKNFAERKPAILKALTTIVKPHLAKDASIEGLGKMLDILESHEVEDNKDESVSEAQHKAMEAAAHGESKLDIPAKVGKEFADKDKGKTFDAAAEFLKGKGLSEDDCKQVMDMLGYGEQGEDESQEEEDDKERKEDLAEKSAEDDAEGMEPGGKMVSKKAMDAAIAKATKIASDNAIKIQREIRDAEKAVHPYVGELKIACDSAEQVYRKALEILGVEGAGTIHASALPTLLGMQPKPGARKPAAERLAQDAAGAKSYAERFPEAARIGNV